MCQSSCKASRRRHGYEASGKTGVHGNIPGACINTNRTQQAGNLIGMATRAEQTGHRLAWSTSATVRATTNCEAGVPLYRTEPDTYAQVVGGRRLLVSVGKRSAWRGQYGQAHPCAQRPSKRSGPQTPEGCRTTR